MTTRQTGYTLLLLLTVLSAGSASVLSSLSDRNKPGAFPVSSVSQLALFDARQALLSYAALYPFLYGPRGAGPGHLPCPDTDALTRSVVQVSTQVPGPGSVAADGPNPPCGFGKLASGRLARHVSLPGYRYLFHAVRDQRIDYHVSTTVINNPVNRIVNDSVPDTVESGWPAVAWVELQMFAASPPTHRASVTPVTRKALSQAVKPAVAAWLVARANRPGTAGCSPAPAALVPTTPTELSQLLALVSDRLAPSTLHTRDCKNAGATHLMLENTVLERVPAHSHWFFRNAWQTRIEIRMSETCTKAEPDTCELVYQRPRQAVRSGRADDRLVFNWQAR